MLLQLVEAADGIEPDWHGALGRAGYRGRHLPGGREPVPPRRVVAFVVIALAVIYAMAALAAGRPRVGPVYWLFDRSDEVYPMQQTPALGRWTNRKRGTFDGPSPQGGALVKVVPVLSGTVAGHRFEMAMGPITHHSYSVLGFSAGGPAEPFHGTNVPAVGGGGFAAVRGLPVPAAFETPDPEDLHWVSVTLGIPQGFEPSGGGTGPKWIFGIANPRVARVDLVDEVADTVVSVPTFAGPPDAPFRGRIWVAVLRLDQLVNSVVPRDGEGEELERWELPQAL